MLKRFYATFIFLRHTGAFSSFRHTTIHVPRHYAQRPHISVSRTFIQMADESSDTNAEERAEAAAMRGRQSAQSPSLEPNVQELFPAVQIDEGVFKYVLIKVQDRIMGSSFLVRGCAGAKYHKDVARPTVEALQ
mmetsp:Transcript_55909/g.76294  ORF Transcript_55909/g.76294 Transcript_55909/m.76294 type:complete len:134 (+) Transcript_55909:165-566(+)